MGLFDSVYSKKSETFTFNTIPSSTEELKALTESDLASPFKTCALTMLVLMNYSKDESETINMLNYLKGPESMKTYDIQFLKDRMNGKEYVVSSFFKGSSPDNNYVPVKPLQITVYDNPYSYNEQGYATIYLESSGADSPRSMKLRLKPGTGEWFLVENHTLSDIRTPKNLDLWA